jgi:tRNA(fMet)-specific endonuclease VapC
VGTPIGANDMLVVAHALALDSTIVTDNEKEFARVRDLARENWLR